VDQLRRPFQKSAAHPAPARMVNLLMVIVGGKLQP
jgi:hypothetical protein